MISWIVASHQPGVLHDNLLESLDFSDDELIVIEHPTSIVKAYAEGQSRATHPVRCYVHHDVRILDQDRLQTALVEACTVAGMVGVIGSRDAVMPWWEGDTLGSVVDSRMGLLDFGPGGDCSILDGLLLATSQEVEWDLGYQGFHGYDHDSCRQMLARGLKNHCLTAGHELVRHNTTGTHVMSELAGWNDAVIRYRAKWEAGPHGTG